MKRTSLCAMVALFMVLFCSARADIVYTLRLSTTSITLSVGESRTVTWSVEPVNLVEHKVTWESDNPYVASVDQRGKITAHTAGSTYVRATLETGTMRRINVTVSGRAVTELALSEQVLELEVGQSAVLTYTITQDADDKRVRWSSDDTSVARVDKDGRVTAVSGGVATITLLCVNGMTATTVIYVPSDVRQVNLSPVDCEVGIGESVQLTGEALPVNARNRSLHWESSDPDTASVDQNGMVTGLRVGECKIGAKSENGVYAVANVLVRRYPERININPEKLLLSKENFIGALTVKPEPEDAETGEMKWYSSDEGVVHVENGLVTARGYGSAIVTVETSKGLSASVQVDVGEPPESVRLNSSLYLLPLSSEGVEVVPVFSPYDSISAGYTLTVSDEHIAFIDEDNVLHARKLGSATLTLQTVEGLTCEAEIRVYEDIKSLYAAESKVTLTQYQFKVLSFYSETGRAFSGQLSARSDDESVCIYTDEGIYARSPGTASITFSNPGTSAVCTVAVTVLPCEEYSTRLVALTFDNGPDTHTEEILELLEKYNIRATFFLLGKNIESRSDLAALFTDTVHELGNHTYDNSSVASQSVAYSASALERTDRAARKFINRELTLLRAPDALLPEGLLSSFLDTRRFVGRGIIMNDLDPAAAPETICEYALSKAYNTCVLTFHDAGENTAEALDLIIPALLMDGYRFVTVSELIEITGLTEGIFSTMP